MNPRDELVGETVEQAKAVGAQAEHLLRAEARLAAAEARDALAPAFPSLRAGSVGLGLGVLGMGLLALPLLRRAAEHPLLCAGAGLAALGLGVALVQRADAEFPSDLRDRLREVLRSDTTAAVNAAASPRRG